MELTVAEIATLVGGELVGDGSRRIRGAAGLQEAGPDDASFLRDAKNAAAAEWLKKTAAGVVLVPSTASANGRPYIRVKNPIAAFSSVLRLIAEEKRSARPGIHPSASIAPTARIGANVSIGPFCVVDEDATVGDGVTLSAQVYIGPRAAIGPETFFYPQVVVREEVQIGARCIVHAGAILGSDGYGFFFADGKHQKIPQVGIVVIEDDVEIGSCTTIDRAMTGRTLVRKGTKIDNLVQIAHNVEIGEHSLIVAQVGIAGSAVIGRGVVVAGQAGVGDHIRIGDGAKVGGQSGVQANLPAGAVVWGTPAEPLQEKLRQILVARRLPEMMRDLKKLKGTDRSND